jgi:hypothetical protein
MRQQSRQCRSCRRTPHRRRPRAALWTDRCTLSSPGHRVDKHGRGRRVIDSLFAALGISCGWRRLYWGVPLDADTVVPARGAVIIDLLRAAPPPWTVVHTAPSIAAPITNIKRTAAARASLKQSSRAGGHTHCRNEYYAIKHVTQHTPVDILKLTMKFKSQTTSDKVKVKENRLKLATISVCSRKPKKY